MSTTKLRYVGWVIFILLSLIIECFVLFKSVRLDWFYYSATNYKFQGLSFDELCDYNANVAYKCQKFNVIVDKL
jgi:hypothetical protein